MREKSSGRGNESDDQVQGPICMKLTGRTIAHSHLAQLRARHASRTAPFIHLSVQAERVRHRAEPTLTQGCSRPLSYQRAPICRVGVGLLRTARCRRGKARGPVVVLAWAPRAENARCNVRLGFGDGGTCRTPQDVRVGELQGRDCVEEGQNPVGRFLCAWDGMGPGVSVSLQVRHARPRSRTHTAGSLVFGMPCRTRPHIRSLVPSIATRLEADNKQRCVEGLATHDASSPSAGVARPVPRQLPFAAGSRTSQ